MTSISLPAQAQQALSEFQQYKSWEQRSRLLLRWAEHLEPFPSEAQCETNRVLGCETKVWLTAHQCKGVWHFQASSEARLLRGLLALLLVRINGISATELAQLDVQDWFQQLGLAHQISSSRNNGLNAVIQRIQELMQAPV